MRALNQRGKGMLGAVSARHKRLAGIVLSAPGRHDFLGFLKRLRRDDRPGGAPVTELFLLGKPDLPAGEIILNFVFVIYQNPAVNGIHQNPANAPGIPVAAKLGFIPIAVEGRADGAAPQPLVVVEGKNLADNSGFAGVDFQGEVVDSVVTENPLGDAAFFGIDFFTPFDALGKIAAFLLRHGGEQGENKLAVPHGVHVGGEKQGADAHGFELSDALQGVHGVPRETANVLDHHHVEQPQLGVPEKPLEFLPLFQAGSADPLVGVKPNQLMVAAFGVFDEKFLLMVQTVELFVLVRGNAAIGGNPHGRAVSACRERSFSRRSAFSICSKLFGVLRFSKVKVNCGVFFAMECSPFRETSYWGRGAGMPPTIPLLP